ncbi:MAG: DUF2284 domain-containing protein [Muribaculaceae bacterium]|nr:DUF2284 domain-containing protein [Muribaculaceae bacterium]
MNNEKKYDVEEVVAEVDRERYVREFRDVATFEACCQQCPNYGKRWGCPPFDHDTLQDLMPYNKVMIIGLKITPHDRKMPIEQVYDLMRPELERMNKRLITLEDEKNGMAFGFVGKCPYCNGAPCARQQGKPCRHPDVVRPSLEAYGFNVSKTASELLGIDMVWSKDKTIPRYLTLVCGLFFNA